MIIRYDIIFSKEVIIIESVKIREIEEKVYNDTFDKTYNFLYMGMPDNIDIAIGTMLTTIETLTTYSGNNLTGRGTLSQIRIDAEIAATETVWLELLEKKKTQTT